MAAKALVHLGGCHEKLGEEQSALAEKDFQKVIADYPDQTEAVNFAKQKLDAFLRARTPVEKADREYKITKIHTENRTTSGFLSPDSKNLALIDWDAGGLLLRDLSTDREVHLLSTQSEIVDCWWSPDNQWIAYLDYVFNIKAISPKGGEPKTIVNADSGASKTEQYVYPMGLTQDSKKLIFQVVTKQSYEGLYMVSAEGGKAEKLNIKGAGPDLSPDGERIVFYRKAEPHIDFWMLENFLPVDK